MAITLYSRKGTKVTVSDEQAGRLRGLGYSTSRSDPQVDQNDGDEGQGGDEPSVDDLTKLSRDDLEQVAADAGVEEPGGYPNKGELAQAVVDARS